MFFFFEPILKFRQGQVCEFIENDSRHVTMPKLFPDRIGKRVIINDSHPNSESDYVWASDDRPTTYRINSLGREVVEFNPRCVSTPYLKDSLRIVDETELRDGSRYGWFLNRKDALE